MDEHLQTIIGTSLSKWLRVFRASVGKWSHERGSDAGGCQSRQVSLMKVPKIEGPVVGVPTQGRLRVLAAHGGTEYSIFGSMTSVACCSATQAKRITWRWRRFSLRLQGFPIPTRELGT